MGKKTWRYCAQKITSNTVLVIDEAGMLPSWDLNAVVTRCRNVGAKLVLVGDPNQVPPVGAGAPLKCLLDLYPSARLDQVMRQREDWARDAVKLISNGQVKAGLDLFADKGLIKMASTEKVYDHLVQDWAQTGLKAPRSTLIFAGTRSEAAKLNDLCQKARKAARWLPNWPSVRVGEQKLHAGDRVLFTRNHDGLKVVNGDLGTVRSINPLKGLVRIKLDRPEGLFIKRRPTVEVPLKYYKDIELGYAVTTHKGQGTTVESAYVLLGGEMASKELTLVQASRARGSTTIYIDSTKAGTDLGQIAERLSVSSRKDLAVEQLPNAEHVKPARPQVKPSEVSSGERLPPQPLKDPGPVSSEQLPLVPQGDTLRPVATQLGQETLEPETKQSPATGSNFQAESFRPVDPPVRPSKARPASLPRDPALAPAAQGSEQCVTASSEPRTPKQAYHLESAIGIQPNTKSSVPKSISPADIIRRKKRLDQQLDQFEAIIAAERSGAENRPLAPDAVNKQKLSLGSPNLDNGKERPRGPRLG